jgi:hypothetical protein
VINFEGAAENALHQAQQALQQTENQMRWPWLPYPLAGLLVISVIALSVSACKSVNHLKQAAESEGDEEDDDGKGPSDSHEEATK